MASKLAYENAKVVQSIVVQHWKASDSNFCCPPQFFFPVCFEFATLNDVISIG
jgi:hypothetical protein